MEINPYLDAEGTNTGHYVNPPDAGYNTVTAPDVCGKTTKLISKQVIWTYASKSPSTLFSHIGCSAQRLPNGNTLICADTYGYVTEVTPAGETVWDYIVPITKSGAVQQLGDSLPMTNSIFRAYRYKSTHPALAGRTLTPGTTIAGRSTVENPYAGKSYTALQRTTEVQYWDSANAYNGYTLFSAQGKSYLVDMQGRLVKKWSLATNPRLLDSGNLLDSDGSGAIRELDWSGNTVWQHTEGRSAYHLHDDFVRAFNPKLNAYTTFYLAAKDLTAGQCLAAGCDPADAPYDGAQADAVVEVDSSGNVVWEWCFFDHGIQDIDSTKPNYVGAGKTIANYPGKLNLNLPGRPVSSGWPNCNSLDYNQSLDQIVVNSEQGEFYIIDHGNTFIAGNPTGSIALAATSAGDFLYRFGDPARYSQGNPPSVKTNWEDATTGNKQIGASSNVHWIASGLPGAGHLMVFNNNQYLFQRTPQSYVFEINPFVGPSGTDTGSYVNPPTAGYNTWTFDKDTMKANQSLSKQVVWKYGTLSNLMFFSHFGSSAQRLPNGNTLICATTEGYMVEVTSDGTVVWEYINPVTSNGIVKAIGDDLPMTNAALRAYRYGTDFSGFQGRDMTPGDVITDSAPAVVMENKSELPDGTSVVISGKVVTANFGSFFYVEDSSRAWGTRVDESGPAAGTLVTVEGTLQTTDGERRIVDATISPGPTSTLPGALMMTTKTMGGATNGYALGVTGGVGLNNLGLLVRVCGQVTEIDSGNGWFRVDDGSLPVAAKVAVVSGVLPPSVGCYVAVTGISSCEKSGEESLRLLRMRGADDLTIIRSVSLSLIPDTGQNGDFSTIFGEDSDYAINLPSYSDNGDGTVTDVVTGLTWQQTDCGEMTWDQAVSYAADLSLAGHDDWRLPTGNELFDILDHSELNPAMNTRYFPASLAEYWWTGEECAGDSTRAWVVNAGGGIGAHPKSETISAGGVKRFHVRCVRGATAGSVSPSLTDNGDGTVTDSRTGLVWQKAEIAAKTWEEALVYAETLSLAGHDDWRLPNIKELRSINDDSLHGPSLNTTYFPTAQASRYWSSTTLVQDAAKAWYLDADYGLTTYDAKTASCSVRCVRGGTATVYNTPTMKPIPGGTFVMGDHFGFSDPDHPSDEVPLHTVSISTLYMGKFDITNAEYCDYLNSALAQGLIEVRNGLVYPTDGSNILCETRSSTLYGTPYSGIVWDGSAFSVLSGRNSHPMIGVRWEGAAAYCNWLSATKGYEQCYNLSTWTCDFTKSGYRLPTEAEWEYAANGGRYYYMFPWGNDPNTGGLLANWENSGDPYETGDYPWTTPVGFYNGQTHLKSEFNWPGSQTSYQTSDSANGYGLYDMAGNVWQWTNDWYGKDYYSVSPASNPTGPTTGDPMPDGKPYHCMRGGCWYNGAQYYGLSRISNRDPGYYRGPQDPNHPYYHVGFRVALATSDLVQPGSTLTLLKSGLQFAEGPAADAAGNVFFSDVSANTIYEWSLAGQLSTFRTNSGGANGLIFDRLGNLLACEANNGRVTSITPGGAVTALASQYGGTRFNEPNDLWVDPKGGVYFTDPVFWGSQTQGGQHVYYINADHTSVTRVISDMVKPNGIIGTPDGTTLYVSDYGGGNTYKYTVSSDGSLSNKTLFAAVGSDGMDVDEKGNVYLTTDDVLVYSSAGAPIQRIDVAGRPTNLCFGGADRRTLFITTENELYSIPMSVRGAVVSAANTAPVISGTMRTPAVPSATDAVWVTSTITDDTSVASAKLTYQTGSGTGTTTTVFAETMCSTAVKPWTGTGAVNTWTVTGNYFEQRTGSNYGIGNVCGMEYKSGATLSPLTSAMMATTSSINAAGTSGYVEFWLQSLTLEGTDGWTFQLDSGSGFVTRLSELSGSSHGWQKYHYDLASSELVSTLKMRFQFTGGGSGDDDRIDLDQITVTVTSGSVPVEVTMYDDGAHGDGESGDHVYGGQIPAKPLGILVGYYVTAADAAGLTTTDPSTAPTDKYSYTVGRTTPQLKLNEIMTDASRFVASPDYPTQTIGLSASSSEALPGYTLVDPMHNKTTYLVDNAGKVVNSWTSAYEPGRSAYLLPNGHLIRACMAPGGMSTGGGEGGRIEERDWSGNLVWYIDYATDTYMMHHDFKVLPNGNIIMVVVEKKTYAEALTAGFNPSLLDSSISSSGFMLPDSVVEIKPTYPSGGTVVWQWHVWDHMIQDYSSSKSSYGVVAQHPELIDSNGTGIKVPQFWNHINGIDYNPDLDQIMLSARNQCEVWVIDHSTTTAQAAGHTGGNRGKGGDLLYRWGNPQQYDMGTSANLMLFQQHDTQWIDAGCPGAGNILVFNNGLSRPAGVFSTIDEITPPVDASGNYSRTSGSAYGPSSLTWTYVATPPTSFYSAEISGAFRLPNGNTLVCEGNTGGLIEVTAAGATAWQYQCPVGYDGILTQGDSLPVDPRGGYMTAVFKAQKYPLNYAAFDGKTLTPQGPIESYPDWIEIRNPGTSAVDMGGMYLSNDLANKTKWQIPSGMSIPAGGYLLFWADGKTTTGSRHTSFTLDKSGGSVALYDTDGTTQLDSVTYSGQITDVSYGRYPDATGAWRSMSVPTPGAANSSYGQPPVITNTTHSPTSPTAGDAVWITATVTDDTSVAGVALAYDAGLGSLSLPMYDDGAHSDGMAGDHIYGGQIPAQAGGTAVKYYITATGDGGLSTTDPASAPAQSYTYSVQVIPEKQLPDGSPVKITDFIVTADFGSFVYVEASDRSFGIRVSKPSSGVTVSATPNLIGCIQTTLDGERYVAASSISVDSSSSVTPLGMPNIRLGGGQSGYQGAVPSDGHGLSNIGLLVRTWGTITELDTATPPAWFTIDDGSGVNLQCLLPNAFSWDSSWQWVTVTGVSSCEVVGGEVRRLLRVRSQEDVQGIVDR